MGLLSSPVVWADPDQKDLVSDVTTELGHMLTVSQSSAREIVALLSQSSAGQ